MKTIAKLLKDNHSIAIAVHVNPDCDCIGSAVALLKTLRAMDKKVYIYCESQIPKRLSFLMSDDYVACDDETYDVCLAVDVAEPFLMGKVKENIFDKAKITCCLDHHATNKGYAKYNYVDSKAAAAGEIVFSFIKDYLGENVTDDVAASLYAAIASDTGSFRYSNTTGHTHAVISELMGYNIDAPGIMRILFERKTEEQLRLNSEVVSGLKFYNEGKVCVAVVDRKLLSKYQMAFDEADDIASLPRSIVGVEVGVYIKVKGDRECKVSLRSNEYVDVSAVAKSLGGGGHMRAAGVTVYESEKETEKIILSAIEKVI